MIETYGKQNVDMDMVKSLVDFVLSVNNVNLLSWGTHTVKYNGNLVSIPLSFGGYRYNIYGDHTTSTTSTQSLRLLVGTPVIESF